MRPERGAGGVAAELMAGGGAQESPWRTPTPYLFLGLAFMMGLIAVALLVLICTRRKPSSRRWDEEERAAPSSVRVLVPLDREAPKVVVVMAGDALPSFLASAKPLVVPSPGPPPPHAAPDEGGAAAADLYAPA